MNSLKPFYLFGGSRNLFKTLSQMGRIIRDVEKVNPAVAFVGVAANDIWLIYTLFSIPIRIRCKCRFNRVLIAPKHADLDRARAILQSANVIIFSGGNMEAGMRILYEKGMVGFFRDLAKTEKIFIGGSAGSIMMAKEWVRWRNSDDNATAELYPCLGLVPIICDTHAENDNWEELKVALGLKGEGAIGYGITSQACLKVSADGRVEAEGGPVALYMFRNGKIDRQPDLLPIVHAG